MSIDENSPRIEPKQRTRSLPDLSSYTSDSISPVLKAIQTEMVQMREDMKKLQNQNTTLLEKNTELQEITNKLTEKHSELKFSYARLMHLERDSKSIFEELRNLSSLIESLDSFINEEIYDKTITSIEDCIDDLEREMKENEVEIEQLIKLRGENLKKAVQRIGNEIGCPVSPSDIYKCHRKPSTPTYLGNVVVKFHRLKLRNDFLSAYQHSPKTTDVIIKAPLTTRNFNLLQKALESTTVNKYKFVFDKNGKVYMKKNKWSSPIHIKDEDDIP